MPSMVIATGLSFRYHRNAVFAKNVLPYVNTLDRHVEKSGSTWSGNVRLLDRALCHRLGDSVRPKIQRCQHLDQTMIQLFEADLS